MMKTQSSQNKYDIVALVDLTKTSQRALHQAVELAKTLNGRVEAFHVKAPTEAAKYDNQLSAMRSIHEDNRDSKNKLKEIVEQLSATEDFPISFKTGYGNVKSTLKDYVNRKQPDILVLGRRKPRPLSLLGDGVTDFVLNECPSHVLITGEKYEVPSFKEVQLGIFGYSSQIQEVDIIRDLRKNNNHPMRMFGIKTDEKEEAMENQTDSGEVISYVFSKGANAWDGITSYVSRTDTQLFCIPRHSKDKSIKPSTTKRLLQKLEVPILIMA